VSISPVIGARSSGAISNFLARVIRFETFAWRDLRNRVGTVQFNNAYLHHYGFPKAPTFHPHCSVNRWMQTALLQFQKRSQFFIRTHKEPLSIVAMRVCNPDCVALRIHR
jgi:hypothetical protein